MSTNVHGHYLDRLSSWRKMAAVAWSPPDDPTIYGTIDVEMTDALPLLSVLSERSGEHVTVTHLVVKALADTLARHPECNGMIRAGRIFLRDTVDLSVLVAMEPDEMDERRHDQAIDLSEAMVRDADKKSVVEIAREIRAGVRTIRKHQDPFLERTKKLFDLLPPALLGPILRMTVFLEYQLNVDLTRLGVPRDPFGSGMVTSVGMLGITEAFGPIPPFSGVTMLVALGRVEDRPVARNGRVVVRPIMRITATFDHRFIDGFQGGRLGNTFRRLMADPVASFWPAELGPAPRRVRAPAKRKTRSAKRKTRRG